MPPDLLAHVVHDLAAVPGVELLVLVTNSARPAPELPEARVPVYWVGRAGKPWADRRLRDIHPGPWAVVGDQLATDGWLARRLNGTFIHVAADQTQRVPWWPRVQSAAAGIALRGCFTDQPSAVVDLGRDEREPDPDHHRREVLLVDYAETRDDERTFVTSQGVAITLLVTILVGLLAVLANPNENDLTTFLEERRWLLAGLPAIPLAILLFLQLQGTVSIIRSYYLRSLEAELALLDPQRDARATLAASYVTTTLEIASLRRGRAAYRLLAMAVIAIVIVVFGGLIAYIVRKVAGGQWLAMGFGYGPLIALLIREFWQATLGGRALWDEVMRDRPHVPVARAGKDPHVTGTRSLASYLLLPRVEELVKLSFLLIGLLYAALWAGVTGITTWVVLLLGLLVFEYLVYEARYQWNDIRGAATDGGHPYARSRSRLPWAPGGLRRSIRVSSGVAGLRLLAASVVCALLIWLPGPYLATGIVLAATSFAALLAAALYERLRALESSPRGVWAVVGVGYGIRMGLGALLIASVEPTGASGWVWLPMTLAVTGWAIGSTSILMAWALESSAALKVPPHLVTERHPPEDDWRAADDARSRGELTALPGDLVQDPGRSVRPHIGLLASTLDCGPGRSIHDGEMEKDWMAVDVYPVLSRSTRLHWWNRTAVLASSASAALGAGVGLAWAVPGPRVEGHVALGAMVTGGAALLGLLAGLLAVTRAEAGARWAVWIGATLALAAGVVTAGVSSVPSMSVWRSVLTGLVAVGVFVYFHYANYTLFRDSSYRRLKAPLRPIREAASDAWLGRETQDGLKKWSQGGGCEPLPGSAAEREPAGRQRR